MYTTYTNIYMYKKYILNLQPFFYIAIIFTKTRTKTSINTKREREREKERESVVLLKRLKFPVYSKSMKYVLLGFNSMYNLKSKFTMRIVTYIK